MDTINFASNKTQVLIIGVSKFYEDSSIKSIPNAEQNIFQLKKTLLKNKVLNINEKDLIFSFNETKIEIERKLTQAARIADADTTLIVYYTGHGIVSNRNLETYLTASNTTLDYLEKDGIDISEFRNTVESSKAARKITIIDACHSGAIHNAVSNVVQVSNINQKFKGSYVITSASKSNSANYPANKPKEPTYFTGKFIDILKKGINNGKEFLTIRDIFEEIEDVFYNNSAVAAPQQSSFQNADRMIFAKNNADKIDVIANTTIVEKKEVKFEQIIESKTNKFNLKNLVASFLM